jgi:hypothetical protein
MSKTESFPIDRIYVSVERKKALKRELVQEIAESILEIGQQVPILVRPEEARFVLVEGLHRLEACKALGETTIMGLLVSAETPHPKRLLADSVEMDAERDKTARLRRLRLEAEAAGRLAATAKVGKDTCSRSQNAIRTRLKTPSSRTSASTPRTLSEWLTQQKRDGGRY